MIVFGKIGYMVILFRSVVSKLVFVLEDLSLNFVFVRIGLWVFYRLGFLFIYFKVIEIKFFFK